MSPLTHQETQEHAMSMELVLSQAQAELVMPMVSMSS